MQESTVRQCFKKRGFGLNHDATEDRPAPVIADDDMGPILGDVALEDYANMDDDAETTKPVEANWDANLRDILPDVAPTACSDDEADATTEDDDNDAPGLSEAFGMLQRLVRLGLKRNQRFVDSLMEAQMALEQATRTSRKKQATPLEMFNRKWTDILLNGPHSDSDSGL